MLIVLQRKWDSRRQILFLGNEEGLKRDMVDERTRLLRVLSGAHVSDA
jgi:hypothetical protein